MARRLVNRRHLSLTEYDDGDYKVDLGVLDPTTRRMRFETLTFGTQDLAHPATVGELLADAALALLGREELAAGRHSPGSAAQLEEFGTQLGLW